jgi:hypothetical protein
VRNAQGGRLDALGLEPLLDRVDRADVALEYSETRHPKVLWYSHTGFTGGFSHDGWVLGDWTGSGDVGSLPAGASLTLVQGLRDSQGVTTIRLDATAAGRPVYEKLGFTAEYLLTRYEGIAPATEAQPDITVADAGLFPEIAALDSRMTGTRRKKMLLRLFEESPEAVRVLCRGGRVEGFVTIRRGANASQIGPCIAAGDAGGPLLGDALSRCAGGPVFIDVPRDNARALEVVETSGLKAQRHFTRMCRGERIVDCPQGIWAGSGPEKG